jgi:hypothetical protein
VGLDDDVDGIRATVVEALGGVLDGGDGSRGGPAIRGLDWSPGAIRGLSTGRRGPDVASRLVAGGQTWPFDGSQGARPGLSTVQWRW